MITLKEFHEKYGRLPTEFDRDYQMELNMGLAASKIQVLDSPMLSPGVCCVCNSRGGDGRKFIDVGLDTDQPLGPYDIRGTVYWCTICMDQLIRELAERDIIELPVKEAPVANVKFPLAVQLQELSNEMDSLIQKVERLNNDVGTPSTNLHFDSGTGSSAMVTVTGGETVTEPSEEPDADESGTSEQDSSEFLADISSITERLKNPRLG